MADSSEEHMTDRSDVTALEHSWTLSVLYMLARLGYATFVIGYGSPMLGIATMVAAVATVAVCRAYRPLRRFATLAVSQPVAFRRFATICDDLRR